MPTQTRFIAPSGGTNLDLSGIFADLDGGTSYGTATKFRVGSVDLTGYFHASTGSEDRPTFNTGYKVNGTDLSTIFRRRGFVGINITQQPTNQIVTNNSSATFSVTATAAGAITYQWYGPSGLIAGATSSSYTISTATIANDGSYYCAVTSGGSTINTNTVVLKIKPYITVQPVSVTDDDLDTNGFSITAAGSATLNFTWYKGASVVAGPRVGNLSSTQDQHTFQFNASTAGTYYCKVTNDPYDAVGVNSSNVTATIRTPIVTISSFGNQTQFNEGNTVQFSSTLTQGTNVTYQWYKNGAIVSGATSSTYNFAISGSNTGTYKLRATNNGGFYDSNEITISIIAPIVTISSFNNQTQFNEGNVVQLSSSLSQGTNVTYQWYRDNVAVSGATSSTYNFAISSSNAGTYKVRATNAGGFDDSNEIVISMIVTPPIVTISSFNNQTVFNDGNTVQFSSALSQGSNVTYQWYRNNAIISGATGSTYSFAISGSNTGTYKVRATNAGGFDDSNEITISIIAPIVTISVNQTTFNEGNIAQFSSSLSQGTNVTYQWYRNNVAVSGATSSTYNFSVSASNTGTYKVRATNGGGFDDSNDITISIIAPVVTITSFNNQTVFNDGNTVQFSSSLSQGANVTYQWYRNNAVVSGATSSTYSFIISGSNTGTYKVRATNAGGFDDSNEIVISIIAPVVTATSSQFIYNNGNGVLLTSSLSQGANVTYQWYGPSGLISGATGSTYSFTMSSSTHGNYYVRATNGGGFDDSNIVSVYMNPIITVEPTNQTVNEGDNAVFSVTAQGSSLNYTWYRSTDGGASYSTFGAANNPVYAAINVSISDDGFKFYCVVSSSISGTTSDTSTIVTLTVI